MGSNDAIAIAGIAVTFAVSVANLIYSLWNNKRTVFVNTVTTSRLKWIDSLRDEVAEFIAVTTLLSASPPRTEDTSTLMLQRNTLLHQIVLHLNPVDEEDQDIKSLVEHVRDLSERGTASEELHSTLNRLRDTTGRYLKKEWNRVKSESTGKIS